MNKWIALGSILCAIVIPAVAVSTPQHFATLSPRLCCRPVLYGHFVRPMDADGAIEVAFDPSQGFGNNPGVYAVAVGSSNNLVISGPTEAPVLDLNSGITLTNTASITFTIASGATNTLVSNSTGTNDAYSLQSSGAAPRSVLVVNAQGAPTGKLIDAQLATVSKFSVDTSGNVVAAGNMSASGTLGVTGTSTLGTVNSGALTSTGAIQGTGFTATGGTLLTASGTAATRILALQSSGTAGTQFQLQDTDNTNCPTTGTNKLLDLMSGTTPTSVASFTCLGSLTISGNGSTTAALTCSGTFPCNLVGSTGSSTDFLQVTNTGTCTPAFSIARFGKTSSTNLHEFLCNGDYQNNGGNIVANSTGSGSGEFLSAGASKFNTSDGVGDLVLGGGSATSPCGSSNMCGGHVHQAAEFTCSSAVAAVVCSTAVPDVVHITTSTNAPTSVVVNFLQAFTNPPLCQIQDETTNITAWHVVITSTTQVKFVIAGAAVNDTLDAGCIFGNGP